MLNAIVIFINHIKEVIENFLISRWVEFYSPFRVRNS